MMILEKYHGGESFNSSGFQNIYQLIEGVKRISKNDRNVWNKNKIEMENDELKESDISLNKLNKNNFNCQEHRPLNCSTMSNMICCWCHMILEQSTGQIKKETKQINKIEKITKWSMNLNDQHDTRNKAAAKRWRKTRSIIHTRTTQQTTTFWLGRYG